MNFFQKIVINGSFALIKVIIMVKDLVDSKYRTLFVSGSDASYFLLHFTHLYPNKTRCPAATISMMIGRWPTSSEGTCSK